MYDLLVLFIVVLAVWGIFMILWFLPRYQFKKLYGRLSPKEEPLKTLFINEFVVPKLIKLAREELEAKNNQKNYLRAVDENRYSLREAEIYGLKYDKEVRITAKNFIEAKRLARRFGVEVLDTAEEYVLKYRSA